MIIDPNMKQENTENQQGECELMLFLSFLAEWLINLEIIMILLIVYVRFEDAAQIRVFRKEDEPSAPGLSQTDILEFKSKMQKEYQKPEYLFNSELKHKQARMESASIKQQKQKQKTLNQKLIAVKEQISYYPPQILKDFKQITVLQSQEKDTHTARIDNDLGCYYTSINEIPDEPIFDIINNAPATLSVPITYERLINNHPSYLSSTTQENTNAKPLKPILKEPFSSKFQIPTSKKEQFSVNPKLVAILQEIARNKDRYSKQAMEAMLQPYKQSGDLAMLKSNSEMFQKIMKQGVPQPTPTAVNQYGYDRGYRPSPPVIMDKRPSMNTQMMGMPMRVSPPYISPINPMGMGYSKVDKFRTVPCKYFHSSQGCVKKDDCTYIHDEEYAGKPTPNMQRYMKPEQSFQPQRPFYPSMNFQGGNSNPSMSMDYSYYPNNSVNEYEGRNTNYQSNSYPMGMPQSSMPYKPNPGQNYGGPTNNNIGLPYGMNPSVNFVNPSPPSFNNNPQGSFGNNAPPQNFGNNPSNTNNSHAYGSSNPNYYTGNNYYGYKK